MTDDPAPEIAVAGLARELEGLARRVDQLVPLPRRVDDLAQLITRLADTTAGNRGSTTPAPTAAGWLGHPAEPGRDASTSRAARDAETLLDRLAAWVAAIYLRYADARHLPDCWLWHSDVVEELLWLEAAWQAAYAPDAPANAVGDWHDRQRPGVVRRIKDYAGLCSLEAHRPGAEQHIPAPAAPTLDAVPVIAAWWVTARDQPPPAPSDEQLDAQRRRHLRGARR